MENSSSFTKSILFLGKFDKNVSSIEEKVVNLDQKGDFKFSDIISKHPDVIKKPVSGYECDAWILVGDVKPTLLLKNLISEADIIILVYNMENPATLDFLIEGWGPIFQRATEQKNNQYGNVQMKKNEIFLVGTYSNEKPVETAQIKNKKRSIKEKFKCEKYIIEEANEKDNLCYLLRTKLTPKIDQKLQIKAKDSESTIVQKDSNKNTNKAAQQPKNVKIAPIKINRKLSLQKFQLTTSDESEKDELDTQIKEINKEPKSQIHKRKLEVKKSIEEKSSLKFHQKLYSENDYSSDLLIEEEDLEIIKAQNQTKSDQIKIDKTNSHSQKEIFNEEETNLPQNFNVNKKNKTTKENSSSKTNDLTPSNNLINKEEKFLQKNPNHYDNNIKNDTNDDLSEKNTLSDDENSFETEIQNKKRNTQQNSNKKLSSKDEQIRKVETNAILGVVKSTIDQKEPNKNINKTAQQQKNSKIEQIKAENKSSSKEVQLKKIKRNIKRSKSSMPKRKAKIKITKRKKNSLVAASYFASENSYEEEDKIDESKSITKDEISIEKENSLETDQNLSIDDDNYNKKDDTNNDLSEKPNKNDDEDFNYKENSSKTEIKNDRKTTQQTLNKKLSSDNKQIRKNETDAFFQDQKNKIVQKSLDKNTNKSVQQQENIKIEQIKTKDKSPLKEIQSTTNTELENDVLDTKIKETNKQPKPAMNKRKMKNEISTGEKNSIETTLDFALENTYAKEGDKKDEISIEKENSLETDQNLSIDDLVQQQENVKPRQTKAKGKLSLKETRLTTKSESEKAELNTQIKKINKEQKPAIHKRKRKNEISTEENNSLETASNHALDNSYAEEGNKKDDISIDEENSLETNKNLSIAGNNYYKENGLVFKLNKVKNLAVIVNSPEVKGDILIPSFIEYKSKKFKVTQICRAAFSNSAINSISFHKDSHINLFSEFAFVKSSLSYLFIPKSLQRIEKGCFLRASNISKIEVDTSNPFFSIEDGLLLYKDKFSELILALPNIKNELTIPSGISTIRDFAFYNHKSIYSLTFPPTKTVLFGDFSFYMCKSLEKVFFQPSICIKLSQSCFCGSKKLNSIQINTKKLILDENCFKNCISLESISFTKMEEFEAKDLVFDGCKNLKSIKINSKQISFSNKFINNCMSLSSFEIESQNDIEINNETFSGCNSLKTVIVSTSSTLKLRNEILNISKILQTMKIKGQSIDICDNFFTNISSLSSVTIESKTSFSIKEGFFYGCPDLNDVKFVSDENIEISNLCLNNSTKLKSISIEGKNVSIGYGFFNRCQSISSFTIIEKEKLNLDINEIKNCKNLETIRIKFDFNESQDNFFKYELESDSFTGLNKLLNISIEGVDIVLKENCFNSSNISSFSIMNVRNAIISPKSFVNCKKLRTVAINAFNKIEISNNSFIGVESLDNCSLTFKELKIGNSALINFSSIKLLFLCCKDNLNVYPNFFGGCKSIKNISFFTQSKIDLKENCFPVIENLESIKIDGDSIDIRENCFKNLKTIPKLDINSNSTVYLGDKFSSKNTQKLKISSPIKVELGGTCFYNNKIFKSIEINSKEIIVGSSCFCDCPLLSSAIFNSKNSVTLNGAAFARCKNLVHVIVNAETEIKAEKFCFNETGLKIVEFKSKNISIDDNCFNKCSKLPSFSIEEVENIQIGSYAFRDSELITSITIHATSKLHAKKNCFSDLKKLESLSLIGSEVTLEDLSIRNCPKLNSPFIKATKSLDISPKAFLGHHTKFQPIIEKPPENQ